jgi:hypothetical protein
MRGGPGVRISSTEQNAMASGIERQGAQRFPEPVTRPPKMFTAGCRRSFVIIRNGIVQWSNITLSAGIRTEDAAFISQDTSRVTIDTAAGWTEEENRHVFVETNLNTRLAKVRISESAAMPLDDPNALIVRWPLVELSGAFVDYPPATPEGEPQSIWTPRIVAVLHDGMIKIPGAFGPP